MTKLFKIDYENGKLTNAEEITQENMDLSSSEETVKWFRNLGGRETYTKYGLRSTDPTGVLVTFQGDLSQMPIYVMNDLKKSGFLN